MTKFLNVIAIMIMAGSFSYHSTAFAQASGQYAYCVSQPGGSQLYVSAVFFVREGDDWYNKRNEVRVAFSDFLRSDYNDNAGYGVTCHFRSSRGTAEGDRATTISHRRQNGWSIISTGWAF